MSELTVLGALKSGLTRQKSLSMVPGAWRNYGRTITEPFAGAWQKNIEEKQADLLTYPTLYACINRISSDIGKLPFSLRKREKSGNWVAVENAAYDPVLRKPNDFQTPAQFREYWMLSKLTAGNTYVLKRRDARGVVNALYILDPERCLPMISESGFVFYQLQTDALNSLPVGYPAADLIVPASEIIHDRCMTLFHPLVGVPPVAAAHWPALKNMKILRSATEFFTNNARPGGLLTGPAGMTDDEAKEVKAYWETNFSGSNAGKLAIIGADMKFTPFDMKSIDAQMVEQMGSSDEQICQPFGIPPFKVGIGTIPAGMAVDDLNQLYYSDALQTHIEHMESLLDQGLAIAAPLGVELDLDPLLRMDEAKRAEVESKLVQGKIKTPNEGRARFNLPPTGGGGTLWGQHQDYPLAVLEKRQDLAAAAAPAAAPTPAPAPAPAPMSEEDQATVDAAKAVVSTHKAIAAMRKAANREAVNV
ncbi:phage portal protein [Pseudorhodoferax soli]|uniref:HK97 family phage portal protein n=1 Tax=Pseudorhodoferax soli TaxID=545864 RepID=A0A368Y156_9BURK|nr:phage portal protein [Pseudorhodoferax soli]RCW73815.1 HK97 family phage portal protein [Pseudorhodoferax soli]